MIPSGEDQWGRMGLPYCSRWAGVCDATRRELSTSWYVDDDLAAGSDERLWTTVASDVAAIHICERPAIHKVSIQELSHHVVRTHSRVSNTIGVTVANTVNPSRLENSVSLRW